MTAQTLEQPESVVQTAPAATRTGRKWPIEALVFAWLMIAAGIVFRLRAYLHWRSLWMDELFLMHSIATRGFVDLLFKPLDYWQGAPAGFLVMERICVDLFGLRERGLRLPSLLAGVASLPIFFALVKRLLSVRAVLVAVCLMASLPPMIHYCAEVKPYSMDVTAVLAILLAATSVWQRPESGRNVLILGLVGAVAVFFSYPAVFAMGGAGLAAIRARWVWAGQNSRSRIGAAGGPVACAAVWGGLEWVNAHWFLRPLMTGKVHAGLVNYWMDQGGFPPWTPNMVPHWLWMSFHGIFAGWETMYLSAPDLGMFCAIIGAGAMLVLPRRRAVALFVLTPVVLAVAAALVRRYPLADRLALCIVPMLVILIAEGVDQIWGCENWQRSVVGGLAVLILVSGPVRQSGYEFRYPNDREESKQIYQWVMRDWQPGDLLVLSHMAYQSFDFYAPRTGMAGLEQLWLGPPEEQRDPLGLLEASKQGEAAEPWFASAFGIGGPSSAPLKGYVLWLPDRTGDPSQCLDDMDAVLHPDPAWHWPEIKRVWVVFVHDEDAKGRAMEELCVPELDRRAQSGISHREAGASAHFYQLP
jgi:4-amino-4-deoxy-L-arabinose transferase-like glycosyltransferase